MKKNIFIVLTLISCSVYSYSQSDYSAMRLAVGLRGGASIPYGAKFNLNHHVGGEGILDVQYTMYWQPATTQIGFLTGFSMGYQQIGLDQTIRYNQNVSFTDCGTILYSNGAQNIEEKKNRIDFEIPVMFALKDESGVFFNFGPRLAFPIWSKSAVQVSSPVINANFVEEGVSVINEMVTGVVDQTSFSTNWNAPIMTLKIGAELGYEFMLDNDDALDLGLYFDWSAYSAYKDKSNVDIFHVSAPSNLAIASVEYNSPSDKYAKQLGTVNIGIKVAYHFNMMK